MTDQEMRAPDWMDAAIEHAVESITQGSAAPGLRRRVLSRVESSGGATRRWLVPAAALVIVVALVWAALLRSRPSPPARAVLASADLQLPPEPLPAAPVTMTGPIAPAAAAARETIGRTARTTARRMAASENALASDRVVKIEGLPRLAPIEPNPLGTAGAVVPAPIAIAPLGIASIDLAPLGDAQTKEGDRR